MAELIKPCPFCGGEAEVTITETVSCLDYESLEYHDCVWCPKCHAIIEGDTKEEAIEAWNNRATEAELRANVIDEFAEALNKICAKRGIGFDHEKCIPLYVHEDGTWHSLIDDVVAQMKGEKE